MAASMQRLLWRQVTRPSPSLSSSSSSTLSSLARRLRASQTASFASTPTRAATKTTTVTPNSTKASATRRTYSSQPPPNSNTVKFWPFVVIIAAGTAGYALLATRRAEEMPAINAPKNAGELGAPAQDTPTFSPSDVTVLFVLGGPGAGKGTQCAHLVKDYGFTHLSAGDLLRAEQDRSGSEFGQLIKDYIKDGKIVPMEVTVQLLENAMVAELDKSGKGETRGKKGKFLIDGFPRKMDQATKFEQSVCPAKLILFYDCSEEEMEKRLLNRGKTSGRTDDNAESIRKRFRTFVDTSMPVVDYYETVGKVVKIDAKNTPDQVHTETQKQIEGRLGKEF